MTKILFPTDFSATANNAFIYALKLANSLNAELFVLHTYEMPIISTMSSGEPDVIFDVYGKLEDHQHEYYLKHTAEMKAIAEKHNLMGVKPTYLFERGLLIPIMEKIINREDVNFVVMGTTGASGIEKKLMGSNTIKAIRELKIPIISVPHNAVYQGMRKIAFTTLYKEKDIPAMEEIVGIATRLQSEINVVHVTENPDAPELIAVQNQWKAKFPQSFITFHTIESDDVEGSIFDFMAEHQINILAMIRRNKNFFDRLFGSSYTKKLSYHINEPVMVLHEL